MMTSEALDGNGNRLIHSDISKQLIDKLELLIIDQDMINALGYKMYIEHLS
jgi:hypothetical protein